MGMAVTQDHQIHAPPERDEAGQGGAAAASTDGTDAGSGAGRAGARPVTMGATGAVRGVLDALNAPLRRLSPGARRLVGVIAAATMGAALLAGVLKPLLLWDLDPFARLRGAARTVRVEGRDR